MESKMKNKENNQLLTAIGAIVFFVGAIPIIDGLANLVTSAINKTINGWQIEMDLDRAEAEVCADEIGNPNSKTQAVGFDISSPSIEEYEEDDEDE